MDAEKDAFYKGGALMFVIFSVSFLLFAFAWGFVLTDEFAVARKVDERSLEYGRHIEKIEKMASNNHRDLQAAIKVMLESNEAISKKVEETKRLLIKWEKERASNFQ